MADQPRDDGGRLGVAHPFPDRWAGPRVPERLERLGVGEGLGQEAQLAQDLGEAQARFGVLRIAEDGVTILGGGILQPTLAPGKIAQAGVGVGRELALQGRDVLRARLTPPPQGRQATTQADLHLGMKRLELGDAAPRLEGVKRSSVEEVPDGQVAVHVGTCRVLLHREDRVTLGFLQLTQKGEAVDEVAVHLLPLPVQPGRPLERLDGAMDAPQAPMAERDADPGPHVRRPRA